MYVCVCLCLSVCLSVCLRARYLQNLRNHTRDLCQFVCACCIWPWFGPPPARCRAPRGRGNFGGSLSGPFKTLAIFAAAVAAAFATTGIIQSPMTSCNRRDHSVCQASANRNPENSERRRFGLSAGNGVIGVHSAGKV